MSARASFRAQVKERPKIDLFPQFLALWEQKDIGSSEVRASRFLELVVEPHRNLYDAFVGTISIERAIRYIEKVDPLVPVIKSLHGWVADDFHQRLTSFQQKLPGFELRSSVVFMPTLFGFDAGGGSVNGTDFLIFGLDTIAKIDGLHADPSVLIAHELFHGYQASFHPEWSGKERGKNIPLYKLVWGEGIATYASQQLNPGASEMAIFRSSTLVASCKARLRSLASLLLEELDDTGKTPFMEWMSGQSRSFDVPPRAGYYFGWRVAAELGRSRSLTELARLDDDYVKMAMSHSLQSLKTG
ncbi:MAG TPA: hypothetical protein VFA65_12980 [Bryobacteraceae bacterium]|nr:hypothetical protein [Bryobacteraceae bacterium]